MNDSVQKLADAERGAAAGDLAGAFSGLRAAVASGGDFGRDWGRVLTLADRIGDYNTAFRAARSYAAVQPSAGLALKAAEMLAAMGRLDEAVSVAEPALQARPDEPGGWLMMGMLAAQTGRFDEALSHFRRALALKPDLTAAWEHIAALRRFGADDPDVEQMRTLDRQLMPGSPLRGPLLFALAKAWDDMGEPERAFAAAREGAGLMGGRRFDAEAWTHRVDSLARDFDHGLIDRNAGGGAPLDRAVVVAGAPRSGLTLVQQLLCASEAVMGGGELDLFRLAAASSLGRSPAQLEILAGSAAHGGRGDIWTAWGWDYLGLVQERFGEYGRVVDRSRGLTELLGVMRLCLPASPVVLVERDPFDLAWSIFRTHAGAAEGWSATLEDLAVWLHGQFRLQRHWASQLASGVLRVPYEALAREPAAWTQRIYAHCGLITGSAGGEAAPGRVPDLGAIPHPVGTAAFAEVRQPIHERSIGAWRRYERQLEPFIAAWSRLENA